MVYSCRQGSDCGAGLVSFLHLVCSVHQESCPEVVDDAVAAEKAKLQADEAALAAAGLPRAREKVESAVLPQHVTASWNE